MVTKRHCDSSIKYHFVTWQKCQISSRDIPDQGGDHARKHPLWSFYHLIQGKIPERMTLVLRHGHWKEYKFTIYIIKKNK